MQRHEHIGVDRGGCAQVDHPATQRQLVLVDIEVWATQEVAGAAGSHERVRQLGVGLADHHRAAGLHDAGLLRRDVQGGRAGIFGVIDADVGDHRHLRLAHVGGIPAPEQTHLDHSHIDGDVGEPTERGGTDGFEVAGVHAGDRLQIGDCRHLLGELVVADRLAVAADALVEAFEVRAGVGTHRQTVRHQQPGDHLRGGALAVGAGDVDDGVGQLRVAHRCHQGTHAIERRGGDAPGGVVVGVRLQVRECVGVAHREVVIAAGWARVSWLGGAVAC